MIQKLKKTAQYKKSHENLKIALIRSNYHPDLTESLENSCKEYLIASGIQKKNIKTFEVSGSWEIPLVTQNIALSKKFNGIAAFGIIIKGETYHFEILAENSARALMNISLKYNLPIAFEILAVYSLDQARKRSVGKFNKGSEAAEALLKTLNTLSEVKRI